jgi:hypothetical protein
MKTSTHTRSIATDPPSNRDPGEPLVGDAVRVSVIAEVVVARLPLK